MSRHHATPEAGAGADGGAPRVRRSVLAYLIHVDSLSAMGVLAILLSLLEWVGALPGSLAPLANLAARLLCMGFFYLVARKAARGKLRLPVPADFADPVEGFIRPALCAALATSWFWIALGLLVLWSDGLRELLELHQAHPLAYLRAQGLWGGLLMGAGLVFLPTAAVGALVTETDLRRCLDPTLGVRLVLRVPRAFSLLFVMLMGLTLAGLSLEALGGRLAGLSPIPLVGPVVRHLIVLWVPMAQARLVGEFVHINREAMLGVSADG